MEKINILDVIVSEKRHRKELGNLFELAASLEEHGLIQPIVIDEDNNLIAGGRRLAAAIMLEWDEIEFIRKENLNPVQKEYMQLEENIRRKQLTYKEECRAKERIIEIAIDLGMIEPSQQKAESYSKIPVRKAADMLGESIGKLSEDLQVAEAIKDGLLDGLADDAGRVETLRVMKAAQLKIARKRMAELIEEEKADETIVETMHKIHVICGKMETVQLPFRPSLVITDPPYGVDLKDTLLFGRDRRPGDELFEDHPELIVEMLPIWMASIHATTADNAHIYMFSAIQHYQLIADAAKEMAWHMDPMPLIWKKSTHGTSLNPHCYHARAYEPIYFFIKGEPKHKPLIKSGSNLIEIPGVIKSSHPTEKPVKLYSELFIRSYTPGDKLGDYFAGTGTLGEIAFALGIECVLIEIDSANVDMINIRIANLAAKEQGDE